MTAAERRQCRRIVRLLRYAADAWDALPPAVRSDVSDVIAEQPDDIAMWAEIAGRANAIAEAVERSREDRR